MTRPVALATFALHDRARSIVEEVAELRGPERWRDHLGEAAALLCLLTDRVDAELLRQAPRLRVVANAVAGYEHVDVAACRARGILVTNTPDVLTEATADLAWALVLATVRRLPQAERSLRAGEFRGWGFADYLGGDLFGATLGVFGMGRIGRAVARRARASGMQVVYLSRTPLPEAEERALGARAVDRDELLATSDVLTLHAPLTPQTRHWLDGAALARMKPAAYVVNTARGPLVDEEALAAALAAGRLAGAGLDVYEEEPRVHPALLGLDNVVLLPHVGSATRRTREAMASLAARNVHAVLSGGMPLTPVP